MRPAEKQRHRTSKNTKTAIIAVVSTGIVTLAAAVLMVTAPAMAAALQDRAASSRALFVSGMRSMPDQARNSNDPRAGHEGANATDSEDAPARSLRLRRTDAPMAPPADAPAASAVHREGGGASGNSGGARIADGGTTAKASASEVSASDLVKDVATPPASPAPTPSEAAQASAILARYVSQYPILEGATVTLGDTPNDYQAVTYYQSGRIVIDTDHTVSLERILAHEIWHVIDWRDNGVIDWGENIPPT